MSGMEMNQRWLENLQNAIGNKCLDWAEKLPKFGGGTIASLQYLREHQRRISEEAYKRTRPPAGTDIEYRYCRIFEVFHSEDFEKLEAGLLKLFPSLEDQFKHRNFLADLRKDATGIAARGFRQVGVVLKQKKPGLIVHDPSTEVPELPEYVDRIGVDLYKPLPSLFVLSLKVFFTKELQSRLMRLLEKRYLSRIRFKRLIPWGTFGGGYREESPESIMCGEILSYLDSLRADVEGSLRRYIRGYFLETGSTPGAKCPAVEVYALRGMPPDAEGFEKWRRDAWGWCSALGIELFPGNAYRSETQIFVWPRSMEGQVSPHRLLVLWEPYLGQIKTDGFTSDEGAVLFHTEDFLNAMLDSMVLLHFLRIVEQHIASLRQLIFKTIKGKRFWRSSFRQQIRLYDTLAQESLALERIHLEYEHWKPFIRRDMSEAAGLKMLDAKTEENLLDGTLVSINHRIAFLKQHISLIDSTFSKHLTVRNMAAMYRLQRRVFWLSILVAIATLIGLASNYGKILELAKWVGLLR